MADRAEQGATPAIVVRLEEGGLSVSVGVGVAVRSGLPSTTYRAHGPATTFAPEHLVVEGDRAQASDGTVQLELRVEAHPDGVVITTSVRNVGPDPITLDAVTPVRFHGRDRVHVGGSPATWSWYRNGWGSFATARAFRVHERDRDPWLPMVRNTAVDPGTPRRGEEGRLRSQLVGVLTDTAGGDAALLGFVGSRRAFGVLDLEVDEAGEVDEGGEVGLTATSSFDGVLLGPGGEVAAEPLLVGLGHDAVGLLERWAEELGRRMEARVPAHPPSGWCSWYYYWGRVTEADVRENLAEVERLEPVVHLDYVMVDDGHQRKVGDWLDTNERFPSGMAALASEIRATGRDAGIWLAPFIVDPASSTARAHPEWLLRTEEGRPVTALWNPTWNRWRSMLALDTTHEGVQHWLRALAHHLCHEWGYRVLKLDFAYAAALPGRHADPTATRADALRRGLDAIRAGAGDEAFLLGCGMPLGPAVGVVDGMRIGPDVAPFWSNRLLRRATSDEAGITTRGALRNALTRSPLHGRLWANDPDCVMVREDETKLTEAEVRTQAAISGLTDGMLVSSDRLALVPPERVELLQVAASLSGGRCRVVDLFERELPELVVSEHDHHTDVGAFNLEDRPRALSVDLGRLGLPDGTATEVFTGESIPVVDGHADLGTVEAHGCRVLRCPRDRGPNRT